MEENYYLVKVRFENRRSGWHIIRAKSEEDALRIREKYGISYPRYATNFYKISIRKMDPSLYTDKQMLDRRRKHWGGSIWYEDENSKLKTEE